MMNEFKDQIGNKKIGKALLEKIYNVWGNLEESKVGCKNYLVVYRCTNILRTDFISFVLS